MRECSVIVTTPRMLVPDHLNYTCLHGCSLCQGSAVDLGKELSYVCELEGMQQNLGGGEMPETKTHDMLCGVQCKQPFSVHAIAVIMW